VSCYVLSLKDGWLLANLTGFVLVVLNLLSPLSHELGALAVGQGLFPSFTTEVSIRCVSLLPSSTTSPR